MKQGDKKATEHIDDTLKLLKELSPNKKNWKQIEKEFRKSEAVRTLYEDEVGQILDFFKPHSQEEMHDKAVEEFSKSETCGEERGTGESVLFYNEKVWDEDAKLIAQKYAVKPESSWEDKYSRDLGMCCPDCDCGHCEIRRDIVNKVEKEAYERGAGDERQFILNVLDGVDMADKAMGNEYGTLAIRHALKSRIIKSD